MRNIDLKEYEDIKNYKKLGIVVVRDVLTPKEVKDIREIIKRQKEYSDNGDNLHPDEFLRSRELCLLPFRAKIVNALKEIIGQGLTYYPGFQVSHNYFCYPGWHIDSDSEIPASYLTEPDYNHVKCGIYLQDDTTEWGGGIRCLPGYHRFPFNSGFVKMDFYFKQFRDWLMRSREIAPDLRAGDAVIFDSRLPHTSTLPSHVKYNRYALRCRLEKKPGMPENNPKMVIYWDASNSKTVNQFMANWERRCNQLEQTCFARILQLNFPDDFPEEFVSLADAKGINIATLCKAKCTYYKSILNKATASGSKLTFA